MTSTDPAAALDERTLRSKQANSIPDTGTEARSTVDDDPEETDHQGTLARLPLPDWLGWRWPLTIVRAALNIGLFLILAYSGVRVALAAPDTFGALLAAGITAWLCLQAFLNIGVVVALLPITGITLPFISAGGSSLIISFAAVGILLAISRETVEKGTWNDDATADRGRRDGRTHLPGSRRRSIAPRAT